ncbi:transcription antitermination factor NusB [Chlamydia sp. 17-3921]|uniref:transcription antitermination factor NusB n=1 Tax=Chlamydia sp. 17-3921 TaxID=2675798 RepID=UPI00191A143C|nr:transcription antitermination factor NusB [Chlamydia sp. 17-3921]
MATPAPEKSLRVLAASHSQTLPQQKMREIVLQMLYALDIVPSSEEGLVPLLMKETAVAQKHALIALSYSKQIIAKASELDSLISKTIKTPFEKLNLMEKNILRLTLFEYLYGEPIHSSILIAEATRLIKKFSYLEARSFVQAVLNDIFRLATPKSYTGNSLVCCSSN